MDIEKLGYLGYLFMVCVAAIGWLGKSILTKYLDVREKRELSKIKVSEEAASMTTAEQREEHAANREAAQMYVSILKDRIDTLETKLEAQGNELGIARINNSDCEKRCTTQEAIIKEQSNKIVVLQLQVNSLTAKFNVLLSAAIDGLEGKASALKQMTRLGDDKDG